jgi:hypothetical protein
MNSEHNNSTEQAENNTATEIKSKREKSTLSKILPTDRIAFEKQVKILQSYAACYESNGGKPVSNQEAGDTLTPKFSPSTLLVGVPFFVDIGLLSRSGADFVPCAELREFNQALALSTSEAKRKLRPIFENTWFYRLLAPRLQLNQQSIKECIGILAVEAKAGSEHLSRVGQLINFLDLAGIVTIVGDNVLFAQASVSQTVKLEGAGARSSTPRVFSDQEEHSLFLDKGKTRKFTINSPLFITQAEYDRVCNWIKVALIVEKDEKT